MEGKRTGPSGGCADRDADDCGGSGSVGQGSSGGRPYVVLVSGTFNPPHKGHVKIGTHAAKALIETGHTVGKIVYSPVHDNYVVNKILSTTDDAGGTDGTLFLPMDVRVKFLKSIIKKEAPSPELKGVSISVLDFEHQRPDLLKRTNVWKTRLSHRGGYLKTISSVDLIKGFGEEYTKKGYRVAIVFGADLLEWMPKWNAVSHLFRQADLLVISRETDKITFGADPSSLLSNFSTVNVLHILPHTYKDNKVLFGDRKGVFSLRSGREKNPKTEQAEEDKAGKEGSSTLFLLPPLKEAEAMSSTELRNAMQRLIKLATEYGYDQADVGLLLACKRKWKENLRKAFKHNQNHWVNGESGSTVALPIISPTITTSTADGSSLKTLIKNDGVNSAIDSAAGTDSPDVSSKRWVLYHHLLLTLMCGFGMGFALGVHRSKL